jgi:PKD repeat protein
MRRLLLLACLALPMSAAVGVSPANAADPVVMAAGDVACDSPGISSPGLCSQTYTSNLLLTQRNSSEGLAAVIAMGDLQYPSGGLSDFRNYFGPSWGRLGSLLRPAPGNHEYQTSGASGYFDYFASLGIPTGNRGEGWYSFDIGSWHFISLNSSDGCSPVKCSAGSPQETWLRNDLAATTQPCIAAYWHHPLSTVSGLKPLWQDLYDAGADFVLVGHTHGYTKPKAMNASGASDPAGPRQVIVGTGGKSGGVYGVLKLTLHANGADWRFVGSGATDSGSATCHGSPAPPPVVTAPLASFDASTSGLSATLRDTSTGSPTSWRWNFGDGSSATTQNPTHTYAQGGTYTVSLTAANTAGSSTATRQVTVSGGTTPPPAAGVTLVADTKANAGSPTKSYGTDTTLRIKSGEYQSYLRFTVSGLGSTPVTGATLVLRAVTQPGKPGGAVYVVGETLADGVTPWTEGNLTWNTMPGLGTRIGVIGTVDPSIDGGVVRVPLDAAAFKGDGTYSLGLATTSTSSSYFSSREGVAAPQLVLTQG